MSQIGIKVSDLLEILVSRDKFLITSASWKKVYCTNENVSCVVSIDVEDLIITNII